MEVHTVHGKFLCILQKVDFSLGWSHPPAGRIKTKQQAFLNNKVIMEKGGRCYRESLDIFNSIFLPFTLSCISLGRVPKQRSQIRARARPSA